MRTSYAVIPALILGAAATFYFVPAARHYLPSPIANLIEEKKPAPKNESKKQEQTPPGVVKMSEEAQRNAGVKLAKAETQSIAQQVYAAGVVAFDERHVAHLRPITSGRVITLNKKAGEEVKRGDVLARIDAIGLEDARERLQAAQAERRQAQAETETADAALKRGIILAKDGSVAKAEVERRRAAAARAKAAIIAAETKVTAAQAMISRLDPSKTGKSLSDILSPLDGVVVTSSISPGELVDTNTEAFTVADLSTVLVLANIYEKDIAVVKDGDPVEITASAFPGTVFKGRVRSVGASVDPKTNTAPVRLDIANPSDALKAGMFVSLAIQASLGKEGVTVPASALQQVQGGQVVFVKTGRDTFQRRDVELGVQRPDWVEIRKGVSSGEEVVTAGSFQVKSVLLRDLLGSTD